MSELKEIIDVGKSIDEMDSLLDTTLDIIRTEVETIWGLDFEVAKGIMNVNNKPAVTSQDGAAQEDSDCDAVSEDNGVMFTVEKVANCLKLADGTPVVTIINENDCETRYELCEHIKELKEKNPEYKDRNNYDYVIYMADSIYDSFKTYAELAGEREVLKSEHTKVQQDYVDYFNSDEYKKKKAERIQLLTEKMEQETDPAKKEKMAKAIEEIKSFESLNFLFDEINEHGNTMKDTIVDIYFSESRSNYVMNRYLRKIGKFGPAIGNMHKALFNIEAKFLGETYRPFNNLFLFGIVYYIAYRDVDSSMDRVRITSLMLMAYKMAYHQCTNEEHADMVKLIENYISLFEEYRPRFVELYETYKDELAEVLAEGLKEQGGTESETTESSPIIGVDVASSEINDESGLTVVEPTGEVVDTSVADEFKSLGEMISKDFIPVADKIDALAEALGGVDDDTIRANVENMWAGESDHPVE